MRADEGMTLDERREYLGRMATRYRAADRAGGALDGDGGGNGVASQAFGAPRGAGRADPTASWEAAGAGIWAAVDDVLRVVWESLD
jgi:hypothetical protein